MSGCISTSIADSAAAELQQRMGLASHRRTYTATAAAQPTNIPAAANPQIHPSHSHGKTTLPLLLLLLTLSDPFPPHLPDAAGDATASGSVDLVAAIATAA